MSEGINYCGVCEKPLGIQTVLITDEYLSARGIQFEMRVHPKCAQEGELILEENQRREEELRNRPGPTQCHFRGCLIEKQENNNFCYVHWTQHEGANMEYSEAEL